MELGGNAKAKQWLKNEALEDFGDYTGEVSKRYVKELEKRIRDYKLEHEWDQPESEHKIGQIKPDASNKIEEIKEIVDCQCDSEALNTEDKKPLKTKKLNLKTNRLALKPSFQKGNKNVKKIQAKKLDMDVDFSSPQPNIPSPKIQKREKSPLADLKADFEQTKRI